MAMAETIFAMTPLYIIVSDSLSYFFKMSSADFGSSFSVIKNILSASLLLNISGKEKYRSQLPSRAR